MFLIIISWLPIRCSLVLESLTWNSNSPVPRSTCCLGASVGKGSVIHQCKLLCESVATTQDYIKRLQGVHCIRARDGIDVRGALEVDELEIKFDQGMISKAVIPGSSCLCMF